MSDEAKFNKINKINSQIIGFFAKKKYGSLDLLTVLPLVVITCFKQANLSTKSVYRFCDTVKDVWDAENK